MTDFTTIRSSSSIIARSAASARSRVVTSGIILGAEGEHLMKHSTDRILTTHTGSLPRPWDLIATLEALDAGTTPDPEAFDTRVRQAVTEALRKQVAAGVDIVNDGEQGKVGYSTYIRHRLTGFEGSSVVPPRSDWAGDRGASLTRHRLGKLGPVGPGRPHARALEPCEPGPEGGRAADLALPAGGDDAHP